MYIIYNRKIQFNYSDFKYYFSNTISNTFFRNKRDYSSYMRGRTCQSNFRNGHERVPFIGHGAIL